MREKFKNTVGKIEGLVPTDKDTREHYANYPQMASSFEVLKDLSFEEVLLRIQNKHGIDLKTEIFKSRVLNEPRKSYNRVDKKYSDEILCRIVLFRLEGITWSQIENFLFSTFLYSEYDDGGEVDTKRSITVRFSQLMGEKVKQKINFNRLNVLFRITVLLNSFKKENLMGIISELQKNYKKVTGEDISISEMFIKLPQEMGIGGEFRFPDICKFMLIKSRFKVGSIDRGNVNADKNLNQKNKLLQLINIYFSPKVRDAFLLIKKN